MDDMFERDFDEDTAPARAYEDPQVNTFESLVQQLESFDDFAQVYMDMIQDEAEDKWKWAELSLCFVDQFGRSSLKQLASSIPRSRKTLESYVHTGETFLPDKYIPYVDFSIHRVCSYTDDPLYWLHLAADNQWSVKRLRDEINIAKGKVVGRCAYLSAYCIKQQKPIARDECKACPDHCGA